MKLSLAILAAVLAATPAMAADKLTPAAAKWPLDRFSPRTPWVKPLGYCAGLYLQRSEVVKATDAAAADAVKQKGAPFLADTAFRLKHDRGLDNDAAFSAAVKEMREGALIVQTFGNADDSRFPTEDSRCAAILKMADALD